MMNVDDICQVLAGLRGDAIVIACQTTRGPWHRASRAPELDVLFRGAMGKGSSLGIGLALAQPQRKVIVLDGDGSLLMNLGSLATIVDCWPPNLYMLLFDNGVYAGTGSQAIPGAGKISFPGFARAAGFELVHSFDAIEPFRASIGSLLDTAGPGFIQVSTAVLPGSQEVPDDLPTMVACMTRLRATLARSPG
jgi:phosphonopyruvate decarboxylase